MPRNVKDTIISQPKSAEISHRNYDTTGTSGFTYPAPVFMNSEMLPASLYTASGNINLSLVYPNAFTSCRASNTCGS
jgi:hypothetical protein